MFDFSIPPKAINPTQGTHINIGNAKLKNLLKADKMRPNPNAIVEIFMKPFFLETNHDA